jgi:hypothetical protein
MKLEPQTPTTRVTISVHLNSLHFRNYDFEQSIITIGRRQDNDLILDDSSISGRHVTIDIGNMLIVDDGSTNGTIVDGKCIQSASLVFNKFIRLGNYEISVAKRPVISQFGESETMIFREPPGITVPDTLQTAKAQDVYDGMKNASNADYIQGRNGKMEGTVSFCLSSGQEINASHILLYPEEMINSIRSLQVQAQDIMQMSSTGLGFFGSADWVLTALTVSNTLNAIESNSKLRKAAPLLRMSARKQEEIRTKGVFFRISSIWDIETPTPERWCADLQSGGIVRLETLPAEAIDHLKNFFGLTVSNTEPKIGKIPQGQLNKPLRYISNDDDFINVLSDNLFMAFRWSSLVSFRLNPPSPTAV